ncbi:MAG: hypothetical protein LAO23_12125 [Acidobacteriia bacterium]|nr:hypothetical protein [Terriglobia bacterium]
MTTRSSPAAKSPDQRWRRKKPAQVARLALTRCGPCCTTAWCFDELAFAPG